MQGVSCPCQRESRVSMKCSHPCCSRLHILLLLSIRHSKTQHDLITSANVTRLVITLPFVPEQAIRTWPVRHRSQLRGHGQCQRRRRGACGWIWRCPVDPTGARRQCQQGADASVGVRAGHPVHGGTEMGVMAWDRAEVVGSGTAVMVLQQGLRWKPAEQRPNWSRSCKQRLETESTTFGCLCVTLGLFAVQQLASTVKQLQPGLRLQLADQQESRGGYTDARLMLGAVACSAVLLALVQQRSLRHLLRRTR